MSSAPSPYRPRDGHGAQNQNERIVVIANPRAGGGRAGARRERIEAAVGRAFAQARVVWTEHPGHATELARALAPDADIVAALGGDGTCHEVVNGLFVGESPVNRKAVFAVLPFGTGGDLVRSLEVRGSLEDALWVAATGMTIPLDVGRAVWESGHAEHVINVAGFGSNAEVCRIANRSSKRWGGTVTFLGAILQSLRTYKPMPVRWRWQGPDGDGEVEVKTLSGFVANGHYCGAGLHVGREGSMADGLFDLTIIPELSLPKLVSGLPRLYDGHTERVEGVVRARAHRVEVCSPVPIELDGEPRDVGPVTLSIVPQVLQVRGAWLRPPVAPL